MFKPHSPAHRSSPGRPEHGHRRGEFRAASPEGGPGGRSGRGGPGAPGDGDDGGRRPPHGGRGGPGGPGARGGHGGPRGGLGRGSRMFEQGAIKLLTLDLLAQQPAHGYDLIKAIERLVGGDYSPSPGMIYPTLTYLSDMGWAQGQDDASGRREFQITPAGREQLTAQADELRALHQRLQTVRQEAGARRAPEIQRAMANLKAALQVRLAQAEPDDDRVRQVAALIDEAAARIAGL